MTIYQRFTEIASKYPRNTFVADIERGTIIKSSYAEIEKQVRSVASYFHSLGLQKGDRLAILLPNSRDWVIADLACARLGIIVVPIHTTYSSNYVHYTLKHSGASTLIVDYPLLTKHDLIIRQLDLRHIIVRGAPDVLATDDMSWDVCLKFGSEEMSESLSEHDLHTIVYTSGTTSDPKGVQLTHRNILIDTDSARKYIPIFSTDRFFSFLPLSHMLERTGSYYTAMSVGASIYFASSNEKIAEEVVLVKPTIMLSVPRMFDKMYEKIFDAVDTGPSWKKKLFFAALQSKKQAGAVRKALFEILVFRTIKKKLGGKLRIVVSGGASLDRKVAKFFQTIGLHILEGYGLTETSPIVAVNMIGKMKLGTVGLPLPGVEIRIDNDKQILVRGDIVMSGYYANDDATKEAIDSQGWFHTGDMGFVDSDGFLTVIGRSKELIVMTNGKKVNPVPVEIALNRSRYISQSMVYGNGQNYLSAFIVPDFKELNQWLQYHDIEIRDKQSLTLPKVHELFRSEIAEMLKEFSTVEQVRDYILIDEEFSQENDLMTPTQKLKRRKIISLVNEK